MPKKTNRAQTAGALCFLLAAAGANAAGPLFEVDYRKLVSRADLTYEKQVQVSEGGLPVGNGIMGSVVWTTPKQIRFQVNRTDVYAVNRNSHSFPETDGDYAYATGYVDIDFGGFGDDTFPSDRTRQHLSVYDGDISVEGNKVAARILAWPDRNVIAIQVTDNRDQPGAIFPTLRTIRPRAVQTRNHWAISLVSADRGRILLRQQFMEGDDLNRRFVLVPKASDIRNKVHFDASSLAVGVFGRPAQVLPGNETEIRLAVKPGKGSFTILVSSAASFDESVDVNALALAEMDAAVPKGFGGVQKATADWWHDFWRRSFVRLRSADGEAEFVEKHYTYFQYVMASSSRGDYPPRFGGMIWNTGGDYRAWGSQFWWHNNSCLFNSALFNANRVELADPLFKMFRRMYPSLARAAEQQWGSKGVYYPETTWFDGLEELPEDIAAEMRELYLGRKPWDQRSARFMEFANGKNTFNSRWNWKNHSTARWIKGNWVYGDKGKGPLGHVNHLLSAGAKIAYLHWLRYDYSQDKEWLREYGYPVIKGVAEFYRNYPNVKKEADGRYHIHYVNNQEGSWGSDDTPEELAAMRGVTATAARASEALGVDADMRPLWLEFSSNVAPARDSSWTAFGGQIPWVYYDLYTLESRNPGVLEMAAKPWPVPATGTGAQSANQANPLSRTAVAAARMGRAEQVKALVPGQMRYEGLEIGHPDPAGSFGSNWRGPLANRMDLREGVQAISVQRLGNASEALTLALVNGIASGPGEETVIHVFPAWPKEWDVDFTLRVRGAFLVSSAMEKGNIPFVQLESLAGNECRVRNPWGNANLTLYRNGKRAEDVSGALLRINTTKGETITLAPQGARLSPRKVS